MADLNIQDFYIVSGYGFIGIIVSMFALSLFLDTPRKGKKINWKLVIKGTVIMTIMAYILNAIIVLFRLII